MDCACNSFTDEETMRSFTTLEMLTNTFYIAKSLPAFTARPYLPLQVTKSYQLQAIQRLVNHAYHHIPFYRKKYQEAGFHPRELRTLTDMERIPTVCKSEVIQAYPHDIVDPKAIPEACLVSKSSGSTGHVLHVVHQANRLGIQGLAMNRLLSMVGLYLPWHRFVYIYTSAYPARSLFGMYPMDLIPTLADTQDIIDQLHKHRPTFLAAYPSHLRAVAQTLGKAGCRKLQLQAISVSSELSTQQERDYLADLFGCGVYDEYSTEELTRIAAQCTHGTYHLFEDVVYTEILDPSSGIPCEEGTTGEVVGTYLHNYVMPFIRYRQGDSASVFRSRCKCGWKFRGMSQLQGRSLDQFVLPSGRVLTSGWLLDVSYRFLLELGADIRAFRMIQMTIDHIKVELVPGPNYRPSHSEAIQLCLIDLIREPIGIEVVLLDSIPPNAAGKHNPIVSYVKSSM
jgi:phenylacetate-CoA ligase